MSQDSPKEKITIRKANEKEKVSHKRILEGKKNPELFLAMREKTVIGSCLVSEAKGKKEGLISVWVHPKYKGTRIERRLLGKGQALIESRGIKATKSIGLRSQTSLFKKAGYISPKRISPIHETMIKTPKRKARRK